MRKKIEDLFAGYNGKYQPSEVDWGTDVGNEIISDQEYLMSIPGIKEKLLEREPKLSKIVFLRTKFFSILTKMTTLLSLKKHIENMSKTEKSRPIEKLWKELGIEIDRFVFTYKAKARENAPWVFHFCSNIKRVDLHLSTLFYVLQ